MGRDFSLLALVVAILLAVPVHAQPAFLSSWGTAGAAPGQFNRPFGLAFDVAGNVYVADQYNNRVQKFTADGLYLTTVGDGLLQAPVGVAVNGAGELLVTDHSGGHLRKFASDGTLQAVLAGPGGALGQLSYPVCVAVDRDDNIYVADWGNSRVQKFSATGAFLTSWSVQGAYGVTIDSQDIVFVSTQGNARVDKFTRDGAFLGTVGQGSLSSPDGISIDTDGGLLVADHGQSRILKFSDSGVPVYVIGSLGTGAGQFGAESPADVQVGPNGYLYASDWINDRIQVFSPSGPPPSLAGSVCAEGGESSTITLTAPSGMVFLSIDFASYGTPTGTCGAYALGSCHATNSWSVVSATCIGQSTCTVPANNITFGDPCFLIGKRLYVQASYGSGPTPTRPVSWGSLKTVYR